jgi:hypothetical protein
MGKQVTYTLVVPLSELSIFPVSYVASKTTPQLYQELQITAPIITSTDLATAKNLGDVTGLKTTNVNEKGQVNCLYSPLFNLTGKATGTNDNIPPKGTLGLFFSYFDQTKIPSSASDNPKYIFAPGQQKLVIKGVIDTPLCNGAYYGAKGTVNHIIDKTTNCCTYIIKCTIPNNCNCK